MSWLDRLISLAVKDRVFSKSQIVRVMRIMSLTIETSISDQEQIILLPQQ